MITLLTGLPGNGKTLRALQLVEALCRKDNRPLFVMGIKFTDEFPLPYQQVPPVAKWTEKRPLEEDPSILAPAFTFPVNAVILIDECQKVFRPRAAASAVPDHVAAFETHRHEGIDFVLLTQHPMFVDPNIRRLTNLHVHMVRAFGAQAAFIHEWQQVKDNCDKMRNNSQTKPWPFPKHIYKWYVSSKSHTHKFRPPLRAVLLILGPLLLFALIWMAVTWFKKKSDPVKPAAAVSTDASGKPAAEAAKAVNPRLEWLDRMTPRIEGMPHTAPAYDAVTVPATAPAPVGCIKTDVCRCYTAQATVLSLPDEVCESLTRQGFYKAWSDDKNQTRLDR